MSPTDPPADMEALARQVDRLTRWVATHGDTGDRVDGLETSQKELWGLLRSVMDHLNGGGDQPATPVRAWLQVSDPEQAVEILTDLVEWLDQVYLRYPDVALPPCWAFHPWVVEELWWLRTSHEQAYGARMWGVPAGQWHDQQRPRVVERIQKHVGSCGLEQHQRGGKAAQPPAAAPLAGHLHAIAAAWTSHGLPPEPTSEQMAEARAHDDARLSLPDH
jgi:hypothetical protein